MNKIKILVLLLALVTLSSCSLIKKKEKEGSLNDPINIAIEDNLNLKDFICDVTDEVGIKYLTYNYLILNDGSLYERLSNGNQLYSNNQKCKKVDTDIKFEAKNGKLIGNDGKGYIFVNSANGTYIEENELYSSEKYMVKDPSIVDYKQIDMRNGDKYLHSNSDSFYYSKFIVLKTDGSVYETYYKVYYNEYNTPSKVVESKVLYSAEDYGKIKYFRINPNDYYLNDVLVTENGYYMEMEVETEECKKYADVACEVRMVKAPLYDLIKDRIVYLGLDFSLLDDKSIVDSHIFMEKVGE